MKEEKKYNFQNILAYLKDKLGNKERYALDKDMASDPFLSDAMDGFDSLSPADLEHDLQFLNQKLAQRKSPIKKLRLNSFIKIAASITLLVGLGSLTYFYVIPNIVPQKLAKQEMAADKMNEVKVHEATEIPTEPAEKESASPEQKQERKEAAPIASKAKKELAPKKQNQQEVREVIDIIPDEELAGVVDMEIMEEEKAVPPVPIKEVASVSQAEPAMMVEKSPSTVVKGKIIDATTKEVIPFANVMSSNKSSGAVSDIDGNFTLNITDDSLLKVSYVGYQSIEIALNQNTETLSIELEPELVALEETQVVSYSRSNTSKSKFAKGAQPKSANNLFKLNKKQTSAEMIKADDIETTLSPRDTATGMAIENIIITYTTERSQHTLPEFGFDKFEAYIISKKSKRAGDPYRVKVNFVIDEKGRFISFVIGETDDIYANELIRLLKEGPKWIPAQNEGQSVNDSVSISVRY